MVQRRIILGVCIDWMWNNILRVCAHNARPPSIRILIGSKYELWFFSQLEVERSWDKLRRVEEGLEPVYLDSNRLDYAEVWCKKEYWLAWIELLEKKEKISMKARLTTDNKVVLIKKKIGVIALFLSFFSIHSKASFLTMNRGNQSVKV